ncbi:MAG: hypothetical protein NC217_01000 [Muribaculaceae bacterium]|nr:hypothetical protein [Muribaculaceae bacterium]
MIKVGIAGGASAMAGELIRILINHPDVRICQICADGLAGRDIKSVHHGLIGECSLKFDAELKPDKMDLLFVTDKTACPIPSPAEYPDLCVIDMTADFNTAREQDSFVVYGVPEVNRKALVRGARRAVIPPAEEILISIALLPLALRSMLPAVVKIDMEVNENLANDTRVKYANVSDAFKLCGNYPVPKFVVNKQPSESDRAMRISTNLSLDLPLDNIIDMYEEIFDDHNLTYVVGERVPDKEVEGTDKCIITLDKTEDGLLNVQAVADAHLRGGAGDAVHVMNLLMGLYEKTGLALRASTF